MVRDGLVAALVFTGNYPDFEVNFVTYEKGQSTVTVRKNFGIVEEE